MRNFWTDILHVPAAFFVACGILALARHVRLSADTVHAIPSYIDPSPATMTNGGKIFDAVIRGDWTRDDNLTVRFIGYKWPFMLWDWDTFHCRFEFGGHSSAGAVFKDHIDRHRQPFCPIPFEVVEALHQGKLQTLVLSVYTGANETELIVEDVVVNVYKRGYHRLAATMQVLNEAAAIVEWIEYHRLLGIEHFYIYDNNSSDTLLPRLRHYMTAGIVTYIWWPFHFDEGMRRNQIQNAGLNHLVQNFGPFNDWVGFFDVDEYFQLNATFADAIDAGNTTLVDLLEAELAIPAEKCGGEGQCHAIQFQMWQIYCNLDMTLVRHARDSLLLELCRQVDPEQWVDQSMMRNHGKMFVKIKYIMSMRNIHNIGQRVSGGPDETKFIDWPEFGRIRHYRTFRHKGALEFVQGTDEAMDRYLEPLRKKVLS